MIVASKRFNTAKDLYDKKSISSFELSGVIGEVITDMYVECEDVYGFHKKAQSMLEQFLLEEVKPIYTDLNETPLINRIYDRCEELGYYGNKRPKEIIQLMTATIGL